MSKNEMPVAVGGSSLMVIFSVLCLVVFALLSASTVQADVRLSEASACAVADYYAADCRAEEIVAQIREGNVPADVEYDGETFRFSCPVSETRKLVVMGRVEESRCEILCWQTVSVADWNEAIKKTYIGSLHIVYTRDSAQKEVTI